MDTFSIINIVFLVFGLQGAAFSYPPPVRSTTLITLYTDPHTWSEAAQICELQGGRLLDITYYSLFSIMLTFAATSPWKDLPIGNGPAAWIGLHRRVTPLGDWYYSGHCERLVDYRMVYWNTDSPYVTTDGPADSFCVKHQINQTTVGTTTSYKHDFTRAVCNDLNHFYCQKETGVCSFEIFSGFYGDTTQDFTPSNDVVYPLVTINACAELCLTSSSLFPHPDMKVIEECWGFSTSATDCTIHNVIKPTFFDVTSRRIASPTRNLYIKRCFQSMVNTSHFDVPADSMVQPNTSCGVPDTGNSTTKVLQVLVFSGKHTWNEGFRACRDAGYTLLTVHNQEDYLAVEEIVEKYNITQSMRTIWLGLHEPDALNQPGVRVWADCASATSTNWDLFAPPSTNISNTKLCTVLETASNFWYTAACNEQHHVICIGDTEFKRSYSNGAVNTVGSGISLGPYNVTHPQCRDMCSTMTFETRPCWGYAALDAVVGLPSDCYLYFVNESQPGVQTAFSAQPFTLYKIIMWTDVFVNTLNLNDTSTVPHSCCDVSPHCPVNNPPTYSTSIPTTTYKNYVLYTTPTTWNSALQICRLAGGTLLQVADLSERYMFRRYLSNWRAGGYLFNNLWIGLSQSGLADPCSLQWAGSCLKPTWVDFANNNFTGNNSAYCVATDNTGKYTKMTCNLSLPFVCQYNVGACNVFDMSFGQECIIGNGAFYSTSGVPCEDQCLTATYNNMECWAAVITGATTCDLYFNTDPAYCKDNYNWGRNDTIFKSCFSATVNVVSPFILTDDSPQPRTGCSTLLPAGLNQSTCDSSSSVSVSSTTSFTFVSSSETSVLTSETISTTLVLPSSPSVTSTGDISTSFTIMSEFSTTFYSASSSTAFEFTSSAEADTATISTSVDTISPTTVTPSSYNTVSTQVHIARPIYILPCLCSPKNKTNMTFEEWQEWFAKTSTIHRYNTSRYRRSLSSIYDPRTSTLAIGIIVSSLFVGIALYLITTDIPRIISSFRLIHDAHFSRNKRSTKKKYQKRGKL